ncbi:MAG TPA: hypothetical protein EYP06_01830, partial [Desulfobacterales bacterium]|nr:hypothetical protein [Desulfobacterales bacterium]
MAARLDSLPEGPKWLVQLASVIGIDFDQEILKSLAGEMDVDSLLARLVEEGFFERIGGDSDGNYRFRHLLMREVAYHSLLRRDRKQLHELTALSIEKTYSSTLYLHAGRLSEHFYAAGNWDKALHYIYMAAEQAQKAYACHEALILLDRALETVTHLPQKERGAHLVRIQNKRGMLLYCVGNMEEARDSFGEMLTIAYLIQYYNWTAQFKEALKLCQKLR